MASHTSRRTRMMQALIGPKDSPSAWKLVLAGAGSSGARTGRGPRGGCPRSAATSLRSIFGLVMWSSSRFSSWLGLSLHAQGRPRFRRWTRLRRGRPHSRSGINGRVALGKLSTPAAQHAEAIRVLGRQTVANVIEIGRRLTEAKALAGHGGWLPWLEREFGWTVKTAERFINVYDMSKFDNLSNLDLPISGLYLLAAPKTPEAARERPRARRTAMSEEPTGRKSMRGTTKAISQHRSSGTRILPG